MVTADAAVPFRPDFHPALFCGGKLHAAVGAIVEKYEVSGNVLRLRAFASEQIPEESFVRMRYKGVAQLNISTEWLKRYLINIPPYAEQKRIVAKIEELFATIDKIKESLEA